MHNSRPACLVSTRSGHVSKSITPVRGSCSRRGRRAAPLVGARGARILPRRSPPRSRCDSVTSPPVRAPARSRRSSDPPSAVQRSGRARGPSRRALGPGVRRRRTRDGRPGSRARSSSAFRSCTRTPLRPRGRPALQQVRAQRLVAALVGRGSAKNSPPGRGWGDLADWTIQIVHLISRQNRPPTRRQRPPAPRISVFRRNTGRRERSLPTANCRALPEQHVTSPRVRPHHTYLHAVKPRQTQSCAPQPHSNAKAAAPQAATRKSALISHRLASGTSRLSRSPSLVLESAATSASRRVESRPFAHAGSVPTYRRGGELALPGPGC